MNEDKENNGGEAEGTGSPHSHLWPLSTPHPCSVKGRLPSPSISFWHGLNPYPLSGVVKEGKHIQSVRLIQFLISNLLSSAH